MNEHRIDRATAERLLRGESATPPQVAEVLAAAAAPARADELTGEGAAVTAFREARVEAAARTRTGRGLRSLIGARAAALVVAAAVGFLGLTAGVSALTGSLPGPFSGASFGGRPEGTPSAGGPATPGKPAQPNRPPAGVTGGPQNAQPSASTVGLCRAYSSKTGAPRGKALQSPAYAGLIKAAGGKGKVSAYCAGVLGGKKSGGPKGGEPPGKDKGRGGDDGGGRGDGDDADDDDNEGRGDSRGDPHTDGLQAPAPSVPQPALPRAAQ